MPLGALEVGPMRSYIVKENHIGSAFSEILPYTQTDILLLYKRKINSYHYIIITDTCKQSLHLN